MMNYKEYAELKLRAMIVPKQASWPDPEYGHWQRLHEAVSEARERVSKAYIQMDKIDGNADLSREGKERHVIRGFFCLEIGLERVQLGLQRHANSPSQTMDVQPCFCAAPVGSYWIA